MDAHMTFDPKKIDFEAFFHRLQLRPRKPTEEEKRYGTFNRRMIAAALDTMFISVLIGPVVDMVYYQTYGPPPANVHEIRAHAAQAANSAEAMRMFMQEMRESGLMDHVMGNFRWQVYVVCLYLTLCWHFWAASPGKILCRLKIVDAKTGGKISDWQSIARVLGYFVSAIPFGLGFFWIGLNQKRKGWHDYLSRTQVVVRERRKLQDDTITSTPESARRSNSPAPSAGE